MNENRNNVRPDLGVSAVDCRTSEVELSIETAPSEVAPSAEGLTEPDRGSAMSDDTNVTKLRRQLVAVEYLEMCAEKLAQAKRARIAGIVAARAHGLSCQTIGDALGITEGAVRMILKRSES